MSTETLLEQRSYTDTVRRWLVTPSTVRMWAVSTAAWMSVLFSSSLLVGLLVGQPRDGVSAGIVLSGICLIVTIDRMWRRLDRAAGGEYSKD